MNKSSFKSGLVDGLPICLGYLSVSFAFGIFAVKSGLYIWQTVLISLFNVTSAGQLAAVPIIATAGSLFELALTELVINSRYSLMSVSLSQRLDSGVSTLDRLIIAFVNTDEVFAVSGRGSGQVLSRYMYGLIILPYIGWSLGTLFGAFAGELLPPVVVSALGIAIYAMFVAIVVPEMKRAPKTALCVALSAVLSLAFRYIPGLSSIPAGFTIVICAVLASAVFAAFAPIPDEEVQDG